MKKLNLAIIGQGRSGRDIHGAYLKSDTNKYFRVAAIVEEDAARRERARGEYEGCDVYKDYRDLFERHDIDLVVNASYSEQHFAITMDLLEHGMNVVSEKPMGRNRYECETLIAAAKKHGATLMVFQQSLFAPFYQKTKEVIASGLIGDVLQASISYSGFSRRWDWQTLQCKLAGVIYNTGPHPIGYALDLLGFPDDFSIPYSRLGRSEMIFGDAEDYAKILITAPGKFPVDLEFSSTNPFNDYVIKVIGTRGTFKITASGKYVMKYIIPGENVEKTVSKTFISKPDGTPAYCSEQLISHTEEGAIEGTAFDVGSDKFYTMAYDTLVNGTPLTIRPEDIAKVVSVIEIVHAQNPIPKTID